MPLKVDVIGRTRVGGSFLPLHRIELRVHNGSATPALLKREMLIGGRSGVAVLPFDPENKHVILVEEPLPGYAADGMAVMPLGLIAGHVETGETPQQAAIRELREETGLVAPYIISPFEGGNRYTAAGMSNFKMSYCLAPVTIDPAQYPKTTVHNTDAQKGDDEIIVAHAMPADEFVRQTMSNRITSLHALVMAQHLVMSGRVRE